jgi:hypothetical protein
MFNVSHQSSSAGQDGAASPHPGDPMDKASFLAHHPSSIASLLLFAGISSQ